MLRQILTIISIVFCLSLSAQSVYISVNEKPLNEVLIEMRDKYDLKFSFDDILLSKYKITLTQNFSSPVKALESILGKYPLAFQRQDGVFVIYPAVMFASTSSDLETKRVEYRISGLVSDRLSGESLPYANILINGYGIACDETGRFSFVSKGDSLFDLKISHLGYYIQDTVVFSDENCHFKLIPATYRIKQVEISKTVDKTFSSSEYPGVLRANNMIANNLPGSGDASVFNLLRLMPGFLAAGEQNQDLIIWGSYSGHSQLSVDGYTLFGLKNFNDNISSVNPYMVKDLQLLKGGYGAQYGGRIGGIVDITGVDGNNYKPECKINLNNLTFNVMASVPIGKQTSLTAAFRQTFYNLYNTEKLNPFRNDSRNDHYIENRSSSSQKFTPVSNSSFMLAPTFRSTAFNNHPMDEQPEQQPSNQPTQTSIYLYPDYNFRDINLKFAGKTNSGDSYFISTYHGHDKFNYSIQDSLNNNQFMVNANQASNQWGASSVYNKLWKDGNRTSLNLAYSSLTSDSRNDNNIFSQSAVTSTQKNQIQEIKFLIDNNNSLGAYNYLLWGAGLTNESYNYSEADNGKNLNYDVQLLHAYCSDQINLNRKLKLNPGLRFDYSFLEHKAYWQPRLSFNWQSTLHTRVAVSWGKYNQFIAKNVVIDSRQNNQEIWMVCDGADIPVPSSDHWVLGSYFNKGSFSASVEAYYKSIDGLYRVDRSQRGEQAQSYIGQGRSLGIDFLIKQQYKRHYAWVSYTLSKTDEKFSGNDFLPAPQDQRHEFKSAIILDFKHWVFSANYVYGSGFPVYTQGMTLSYESRKKYSRFDTSLNYRFSPRRFNLQTGISVLNLFDYDNLKLNELVNDPSNVSNVLTIYSHSIPFTPMLFVELSF